MLATDCCEPFGPAKSALGDRNGHISDRPGHARGPVAWIHIDAGGRVPAVSPATDQPLPIAGAANIQLDVCSPNLLIQEGIQDWSGFHADILEEPVQGEKGYIIPPTRPGLGVELNETVLEKYAIQP